MRGRVGNLKIVVSLCIDCGIEAYFVEREAARRREGKKILTRFMWQTINFTELTLPSSHRKKKAAATATLSDSPDLDCREEKRRRRRQEDAKKNNTEKKKFNKLLHFA